MNYMCKNSLKSAIEILNIHFDIFVLDTIESCLDDYSSGMLFFSHALEILEHQADWGYKEKDSLRLLNTIAKFAGLIGFYHTSYNLGSQAIAVFSELYGGNDLRVLGQRVENAKRLDMAAKFEEAVTELRSILTLIDNIQSSAGLDQDENMKGIKDFELGCQGVLAGILVSLAQYEEAGEIYRRLVAVVGEYVGKNEPEDENSQGFGEEPENEVKSKDNDDDSADEDDEYDEANKVLTAIFLASALIPQGKLGEASYRCKQLFASIPEWIWEEASESASNDEHDDGNGDQAEQEIGEEQSDENVEERESVASSEKSFHPTMYIDDRPYPMFARAFLMKLRGDIYRQGEHFATALGSYIGTFLMCQRELGVLERLTWETSLAYKECLIETRRYSEIFDPVCNLYQLGADAPNEGIFRLYRARHEQLLGIAAMTLALEEVAEKKLQAALELFESLTLQSTSPPAPSTEEHMTYSQARVDQVCHNICFCLALQGKDEEVSTFRRARRHELRRAEAELGSIKSLVDASTAALEETIADEEIDKGSEEEDNPELAGTNTKNELEIRKLRWTMFKGILVLIGVIGIFVIFLKRSV